MARVRLFPVVAFAVLGFGVALADLLAKVVRFAVYAVVAFLTFVWALITAAVLARHARALRRYRNR